MISTISIPVCRTTIEIKIPNYEPVNMVRHLDVFKPPEELSFALRGARGIYISQNLGYLRMKGRKLDGNCITILKDHIARQNSTLPNDNGTPRRSNRG
jgi:hypothetical protein